VAEKSAHLGKLLESVKWRVMGFKGDDADGQPLAHPVSVFNASVVLLKPPQLLVRYRIIVAHEVLAAYSRKIWRIFNIRLEIFWPWT
jgi:hypothetical protein